MLSVEESARMLGISGARVRKLIADGLLPATKVGRSWTIEEAAVMDRLLAEYEGADRATVSRDVADIIGKLRSIGALEE